MKVLLGFIIIFIAIVISQTQLSFLKNKKVNKLLVALFFVFTLMMPKSVKAAVSLSVSSPYCYVYDLTSDQVLYSKSADAKIYPASMTKVMTALVALDHIEDLSEVVTMEKYDFKGLWEAGASVANLEVGEQVTYRDLIYGIILPSGADACRAMARCLFGTEEKMAEAMNEKAKELGLTNTHFVNTSGLHDDNHYTTVYEMAIITKEALKDPFFKQVFSTRSYRSEISNRYMAASILKLKWKSGMDISHIVGCKTGYTDNSKSCLTALINCDGHDVITVFAKASGSSAYVADAKNVKTTITNAYHPVDVYKKGDVITSIRVDGGLKESIDIVAPQDISLYVENAVTKDDLKIDFTGKTSIKAPVEYGEDLGSLEISLGDKVLETMSFQSEEFIDMTTQAKIIQFIFDNILYIAAGILLVAGGCVLTIKRHKKRNLA